MSFHYTGVRINVLVLSERNSAAAATQIPLHSQQSSVLIHRKSSGYPQRYAQEALGHNSKAVHQAYAKWAEVEVPSLDEWEKQMSDKVIQLKLNSFAPLTSAQSGRH